MLTRIRKVFTDTKNTQTEIAKKLNVSPQYIWKLMNNNNVHPSDQFIANVCRSYSINEEWLRNGTGEMFQPLSRNEEIAAFMNDVMEDVDDSIRKAFILALTKLDDRDWETIAKLAHELENKDG